jgi:predicted transcriptional regulator
LDDDVNQMLNTFAEKSNTRKRNIVNNALRHYICLQGIMVVRKEIKPYAEGRGFHSEEDILNSIS